MEHLDLNDVKNTEKKRGGSCILASSKKKISRKAVATMVDLKRLDVPLVATTIRLERDQPYTIGRSGRLCQLVFDDRRVSKQHCQILFDASLRKLYLLDGSFSFSPTTSSSGGSCFLANQCGNRFVPIPSDNPDARVRASLNGVFVNGVRIRKGLVMELSAGDEVLLVCANDQGLCGSRLPMGFLIQRIVFEEEVLLQGCNDIPLPITSQGHSQGSVSSGKFNRRIFALRANSSALSISKWDDLVGRANSLSTLCRTILQSDDPISYIRRYPFSVQSSPTVEHPGEKVVAVKVDSNHNTENVSVRGDRFCHKEYFGIPSENANISSLNSVGKENPPHFDGVMWNETCGNICPPPGNCFCLNRLEIMNQSLFSHRAVVSLPELLHPVESISRLFIATFTSDILWFLSYCKVPCHLPVTLACHNTERCWSAGPDKRSSVPYPDFPNLVVVYPPFPDAVAFGKDRKKQGIACHHPKLLVSQRENSIRVIITSANLVAKQWNKVTNTIWWQDFPRRSSPNYLSLFTQIRDRDTSKDAKSDFAAQLARFIASLLTDVPSQAHWIIELTKYDFGGADGYLIASVPGIHSYRAPAMIESTRFLPANHWASCSFGVKFLGSVEASVVGLSHLFRTAADSNGAQLKKLAAFLGKSCDRAYGMSEIVLRRNKNVPADANAVSVLVPNPDKFSVGDFVQLGFLPRIVAKWVSPLWDIGFFRFSGCVCPKEALAAALGGNGMNIQLILYVSQGPHFQDISKMMQPKHVVALCSLIASVQSNSGLWRLQEVLGQYRWPESLESDFIYGSSSIGSAVNPQFLAAFSTASGKRSLQSFESEESDPEVT
ncbi:hypothetical protein FH972_020945 [Carpinus fangiana]|uniref:FHA domain-containing protein n=1 Tax=Carpinus fangiana TaxID=176857 RepID=A0A5N6RUS3_9ROSI|nr:hypothetical protein FH972_020945 [Carpinus fangiana]KAE8126207.1 hypothetical protein FH972_020945 [Carpinus fangiana]